MMVAQAAVDPSILSLVGNGVTIVVLAWYVIYDVRTRSPAMLSAFTNEQTALRAAFTQEQSLLRTTFSNEQAELRRVFTNEQGEVHKHYNVILDRMRETFSNEQNTTRATFISQQQSVQDRYDKELSQMRQMLFENMTNMRKAVHDVKDTAQTLIHKRALKDMTTEMEETQ